MQSLLVTVGSDDPRPMPSRQIVARLARVHNQMAGNNRQQVSSLSIYFVIKSSIKASGPISNAMLSCCWSQG